MTNNLKDSIKSRIKNVFYRLGYEINKVKSKNSSDDYQKLADNYKNIKILKLHIGCGPRILKGWINIDLKYESYQKYMKYYTNTYYPKEIRGNKSDFYAINIVKRGLPLPNNSVDVIFNEDFIEHLNQRDQIIFLTETLRVLKPGHVHRINTPNLLFSMKNNSDFSTGIKGIFLNEWDNKSHLNILTPSLLKEFAMMVGYSKVIFNSKNNSTSKLVPLEYRPDPKKPECANIFADLIK